MADADEDAIPMASSAGPEDLEDETQDFRFLTQLTSSQTAEQAVIPKRGVKDFEPNPTRSQASALDASRLAMHTALSAVRIHAGKNHVVGQYVPCERDWRWDDDGAGVRHGRCVVVHKFKSTQMKVMGQADRNNWVWLLPEEALYLLERGSLDIRWPDVNEQGAASTKEISQDGHEAGDATLERSNDDVAESETNIESSPEKETVGELPMSLQAAYASLIGTDGLTLERYTVYAALKRAGYIVQRAPTWHDSDPEQANGHNETHPPSPPTTALSTTLSTTAGPRAASRGGYFVYRLVSWLFQPRRGESCPSLGPLVAPGLYRNYADIFRALSLVPFHGSSNPSLCSTSEPIAPSPEAASSAKVNPQPPFRVHFHVWKPNVATTYRKTAPPPPDYRIAVIDARSTPCLPTLFQVAALLDSQPADALSRDKAGRMETRIKHGRRNVLLAIVDAGIVSYLRLSDSCFGAEKLFEEKVRAGSKAKGRGPGHGPRRPPGQGQGQGQGRRR